MLMRALREPRGSLDGHRSGSGSHISTKWYPALLVEVAPKAPPVLSTQTSGINLPVDDRNHRVCTSAAGQHRGGCVARLFRVEVAFDPTDVDFENCTAVFTSGVQ
jgi:hypothetical protein